MYKLEFDKVTEMFAKCAYKKDAKITWDAVRVEGIFGYHYFHVRVLETLKNELAEMLKELPSSFIGEGNSDSFLNLGLRNDGSMWCGDNATKEMLFLMASGVGLAKFTLPRNMWGLLPDGLPYITITL